MQHEMLAIMRLFQYKKNVGDSYNHKLYLLILQFM